MKRIWAICKKELKRFFTDIRMVMSLVIPGIAIFLIYTFLGEFFTENLVKVDLNHNFNIVMTNNYNDESEDESLLEMTLKEVLIKEDIKSQTYTYIDKNNVDSYKEKLKNKEIDSLIIFDDNFEKNIFNGVNLISRPNVEIYFNSELKESEFLYPYINQTMSVIYASYTVNNNVPNPNLGTSSSMTTMVLSSILPMITISILYSVTLSVCPEAIAGEKERGTLSSILITPIKRYEFALGKILALSIVSLFGGVISAAGVILSLPRMLSGAGAISISPGTYALMFFIFISIVIFFVNIATTISTFAKTTKEATSYLSPFVAIFMVCSLVPAFMDCSSIGFSFVPILNTCQILSASLNGSIDIMFLGLTLLSNLVYSIILILIDIKLFNTESVVMRQ